jgi:hypothetical protein
MRVNSALLVSVGVDALDYLAPMLSAMQIVGDISDKGSKKKEWLTIKKKEKVKGTIHTAPIIRLLRCCWPGCVSKEDRRGRGMRRSS